MPTQQSTNNQPCHAEQTECQVELPKCPPILTECHPELVSGSNDNRLRTKFGMTSTPKQRFFVHSTALALNGTPLRSRPLLVQAQNDRVCKKAAFTLAEVLITLGIIGIVAAITIPMLMTKYEKIRNVNQLKKTYSELSQAFKAASEENDLYTIGDNWQDRTAIVKALEPYIKILNVYTDNSNGINAMCYEGDIKSVTKGPQYGWFDTVGVSTPFSRKTASIKLLNGACVGFDLYGQSRVVFIDINGSQSRPNLFGKDMFMFECTSNNSFIPRGYNLPYSEISSNCKKGGKGGFCAARIIRDGWKINYY